MTTEQQIMRARDACEHAGIAQPRTVEILQSGWNSTVFQLDADRILKIYENAVARQRVIEPCALRCLERGDVAAPRLVSAGNPPNAPAYTIMTRVPGASVEHVWDHLDRAQQLAVARQMGALTAAFHSLPRAELDAAERRVGSGRDVIEVERAKRLAEIESTRLSPSARADLLRFVRDEAPKLLVGPMVFAHCDLSHAHFLSSVTGAISGVIDWAEAMTVTPEWDLAYLWFWGFTYDAEAMRACLEAYYEVHPRPDRLARRCYAAALHSDQWRLAWSELREIRRRHVFGSGPMDREVVALVFPAEVFGAPD